MRDQGATRYFQQACAYGDFTGDIETRQIDANVASFIPNRKPVITVASDKDDGLGAKPKCLVHHANRTETGDRNTTAKISSGYIRLRPISHLHHVGRDSFDGGRWVACHLPRGLREE